MLTVDLAVFHTYELLILSMSYGVTLFLLSTLLANALRLRQGIKSGQLSLRFMAPTLVPGLSMTATISLFYLLFDPNFSFYMFSGNYSKLLSTFFLLALVGIVSGSALYLIRQLRRIEFAPGLLRLTFFLAGLTTLSMLVTLGLLLYEAQVIYLYVHSDRFKLTSMPLFLVIVICLALPTLFSCFSFWRGLTARRELALG